MAFVEKAQGLSGDPVDSYLDRAVLQSRAESRRTVSNDGGGTPSLFVSSTITSKVFARGMAGQINSIQAYFKNSGASGTVIFGFRPFLDATDEFYISATVLGGSGWQTVNVQRSWLFDRLIVVVYFISASSIGVGYDTMIPFDRYDLLVTGGVVGTVDWTAQTARLYIRVTIGAQETEAVPVTGTITVKNIEEPIVGGAMVIRPTSDTGRIIFVDRFMTSPMKWSSSFDTTSRFFSSYPSDSGVCLRLGTLNGISGPSLFTTTSFRSGKLGFECAFTLSLPNQTNFALKATNDELDFILAFATWPSTTSGTTAVDEMDCDFKLLQTNGALGDEGITMKIVDDNNGFVYASQSIPIEQQGSWHHMKGVLDVQSRQPLSFTVDNMVLLAPSSSPKITPTNVRVGVGQYALVAVKYGSPSSTATDFLIGDVVVTQE